MPSRNKIEFILATVVSMLILVGLLLIGLKSVPNASGDIEPLFPVREQVQTGTQPAGMGATGTPASRVISATATLSQTTLITRTAIRPSIGTPTPIRVTVGTQRRAWVFYHGPATYVRADAFAPLPLSSFPRPTHDNGRGLHWFPTTHQSRAVVNRFVPELVAMKIRWLVVLQGMNDWDLIANDYLIDRLNAEGIIVVMRIDRPIGKMDSARLGWIVARYRERGVRYFQIFNEPNADDEWSADTAHTPGQFVSYWTAAAEVVAANGGLPGFAPMSPQPDDSDLLFFKAALEEMKTKGRFDLVNQMWVSVHNYGDFDPRNSTDDGFFHYRSYDGVVKKVFGESIPLLVTEGGTGDADQMVNVIAPMYRFVANGREPYLLAFAPWLIGNAVGGGHDPRWEPAAWFKGTHAEVKPSAIFDRVKSISP